MCDISELVFQIHPWLSSENYIIICDMIKGNESDVANIDFEL